MFNDGIVFHHLSAIQMTKNAQIGAYINTVQLPAVSREKITLILYHKMGFPEILNNELHKQ